MHVYTRYLKKVLNFDNNRYFAENAKLFTAISITTTTCSTLFVITFEPGDQIS